MDTAHGKTSQLQVGAVCAWIVGICYVLIVFCAFLSPASVASYVASVQYFKDFQSYHYSFILLKCLMVVANGAMVGVVMALYSIRLAKHEGSVLLFSVLALIGLGIGMFQSVVDATQIPHLAASYAASSAEIQHVIIAFGVANPAIYALSLGLPGLWFIVIGFYYRRLFPKFLVFLAVAWGLGNIVTVIAHLMILIWLIYLVAAGALVMAPLWTVWQSKFLLQQAKRMPFKSKET
ncbi:MAG: hypothetical protein K0U13_00685 [Chlamydiae bacterium]|nr:hypothetical protein [Chlamydiales bacterium]MCH9703281.1 hypothetical protein [Chlamydiota bacterium]